MRRIFKLTFVFALALVLGLVLAGCKKGGKQDKKPAVSEFAAKVGLPVNMVVDEVRGEFEFIKEVEIDEHTATVVWESANKELFDFTIADGDRFYTGAVKAEPAEATPVVITATVTFNDKKAEKEFTITVAGPVPAQKIGDVRQKNKGDKVSVEGTVILLVPGKGDVKPSFYIQDDTGVMFVYSPSSVVEKGNKVKVTGAVTIYNGNPQIDKNSAVEILEAGDPSTVDPFKDAEVLTPSQVLNFPEGRDSLPRFFKLRGILEESKHPDTPVKVVDRLAPLKSVGIRKYADPAALKEAEKAAAKPLAVNSNQVYEMNAVTYDFDAGQGHRVIFEAGSLKLVDFEEPTWTDEQKAQYEAARFAHDLIQASQPAVKVNQIDLTNVAYAGTVITLKSSDETAISNTGAVTATTEQKDVVLTITAQVGEKTATEKVELIVKEPELAKINTIIPLAKGEYVKTQGVVYGKIYKGFTIHDGTGFISIIEKLPEGIAVGDSVEVIGLVNHDDKYNNIHRVTLAEASVKKLTEALTVEAPATADEAAFLEQFNTLTEPDATKAKAVFEALNGKIVTVKGKVVSMNNNFRVQIDVTNGEGVASIVLENVDVKLAGVIALADKTVEVKFHVEGVYYAARTGFPAPPFISGMIYAATDVTEVTE